MTYKIEGTGPHLSRNHRAKVLVFHWRGEWAYGVDEKDRPQVWKVANGEAVIHYAGDNDYIIGPYPDIVVSAIIFSDGSLLNVPGNYGLRKIVDGNVQLEDNMAKHLKVFRPENELPPEYRAAINDLMDVKFR